MLVKVFLCWEGLVAFITLEYLGFHMLVEILFCLVYLVAVITGNSVVLVHTRNNSCVCWPVHHFKVILRRKVVAVRHVILACAFRPEEARTVVALERWTVMFARGDVILASLPS